MKFARVAIVTVTMGAVFALPSVAAVAGVSPSAVYVSPTATSHASDRSCGTAAYATIQSAVEGARVGATIVVCAGTYHESVTVDRRVNLAGNRGATIDATGQPY